MTGGNPRTLAAGRACGYVLGQAGPRLDGVVSRALLKAAMPYHVRLHRNYDAAFRRWLSLAEQRGSIQRGRVLIKVRRADHLLSEALRDVETLYPASAFADWRGAQSSLIALVNRGSTSDELKAIHLREATALNELLRSAA